MFSHLRSATTYGIGAHILDIETNVDPGIFNFTIVGLPDNAVRESRERVGAAIKNAGLTLPPRRFTVNLAPADMRKEGAAFDLPIALGLLAATGQIRDSELQQALILGELSLDGALRPVRGVLSIALEARRRGLKRLVVPRNNADEAGLVHEIDVIGVDHLKGVIEWLDGRLRIEPTIVDRTRLFDHQDSQSVDLSEVKGQENVKRAFEVAAAGGHNLIMVGPPGSGKTMIARRLPTLLPEMSFDEALETTRIHSVAGVLPRGTPLITQRPFRSPHHTISDAALVGGGMGVPRPGEISLAHHGVLFLDEMPEFARNVLEVLRQPLEERAITIARSRTSLVFPANFQLVASMNPCPCGNLGNPNAECSCTPQQVQRYMARISGPLLDRIDMHIEVSAVRYRELSARRQAESSKVVRNRVVTARDVQRRRFTGHEGLFKNADMGSRHIAEWCRLTTDGSEILRIAMHKLGFSARAYDRILKLSRTVADLAGSHDIGPEHLSEAIQYRSLDRQFWSV